MHWLAYYLLTQRFSLQWPLSSVILEHIRWRAIANPHALKEI